MLSFNGMPLKVRNTFLSIEEDAHEEDMTRKSRSVPLPPGFFAEVPSEAAGGRTPSALDALLSDLRQRTFSSIIEGPPCDEQEPIEEPVEAGYEWMASGYETMTPEVSMEPVKIPLRANAVCWGVATGLSAGVGPDMHDYSTKLVSSCSSDASTCASPVAVSPRGTNDFRSQAPVGNPGRARLQLEDVLQLLGADDTSSESSCEGGSAAQPQLWQQSMVEAGKTTFMVRSLPHSMDRSGFERLLASEGFGGAFDFIYLPSDLQQGGCFGYGFINLVSPEEADRFARHFNGFCWQEPGQEPMGVHVSEALQGLGQLIDRYRNSPLMHKSVAAWLKPAVYRNGVLARFPAPTERLRAPRVRTTQNRKPPQNQ